MNTKKFINYSMIFGLLAVLSAACGSSEKHIYTGNLLEAKFAGGSNYASSQIEHKDVEAIIEIRGKNDSLLDLKSKDGLKIGDCELPIKFYLSKGENKGDISGCDRKNNSGATEARNISGKTESNGNKIRIELTIDDVYYTFEGTEK